MAEPFIGEIRPFANSYAPVGWALCEGQLLQISINQALYSILGTVYGGNGITTFALPDLRGRVPIHVSSSLPLGNKAGETTHTLTVDEMPQHIHHINSSSDPGSKTSPAGHVWAAQNNLYGIDTSLSIMNTAALSTTGASQPHNNMQPYLAINFCIALQGIFPSRN